MNRTLRELGFDTLLVVTSGIALAAYMLGVLLNPMPAAVVGLVLVVVGVATLAPRRARATAGALGVVAFGLAGVVVPRAVDSLGIGDELAITLAGSGLVLLLAFALLRLTAFRGGSGSPA
jgi:hypothetical protein